MSVCLLARVRVGRRQVRQIECLAAMETVHCIPCPSFGVLVTQHLVTRSDLLFYTLTRWYLLVSVALPSTSLRVIVTTAPLAASP